MKKKTVKKSKITKGEKQVGKLLFKKIIVGVKLPDGTNFFEFNNYVDQLEFILVIRQEFPDAEVIYSKK